MSNDVVINIRAKDLASSAFSNVASRAKSAQGAIQSFGESTSRVNQILGTMAGFTAATVGINGLAEAFHNTMGEALDFYKVMQQGVIATAGTIMSVTKLDGKQLSWAQSMEYSTAIMKKLSDQAIATGVSTKELADSFRAALPAAMQGGMSVEQLIKILAPLSSMGKLQGLTGTILMRDINDILAGQNVGRTKLGQTLGLTSQEIQTAKQNGQLYEFLMKRLQGETIATTKYLDTFDGRLNHLKESFARVGGDALKGAFDTLKDDMQEIAEKMVIVDQETQQVYVRPEAISAFRTLSDLVTTASNQIKGLASDFSGTGRLGVTALSAIETIVKNLRREVETLFLLWVGSKVASKITDLKNGITGAAEAHTLLGRTAAAAREEIVKETAAASALRKEMQELSSRNNYYSVSNTAVGTGTVSTSVYENKAEAARTASAEEKAAIAETNAAIDAQNAKLSEQAAQYRKIQLVSAEAAATQEAGSLKAYTASQTQVAGLQRVQAETKAVGVQASVAGMEAASANYRATQGMGAVVAGLKGIGKAVLALTGGWIGLGIAASMAVFEMGHAYQDKQNFMKNHAVVVNGEEVTTDEQGNYYRAKHLSGGYTDYQLADDLHMPSLSDEEKDQYARIYHYKEVDDEAQQRAEEEKKAKEISEQTAHYINEQTQNAEIKLGKDGLTYGFNEEADGAKDAAAAAKSAARAGNKYAEVMDKNAKLVEKANERVISVIESLNDQLTALNGSKYEQDKASAERSYRDAMKQINQGVVQLSNVIQTAGGGASEVGSSIMSAAQQFAEGEHWKSAAVSDDALQCAAWVSEVYHRAGISGIGSINGNDLVNQFGSAYHDAAGYTPKAGDLINWSEHVGISDGQGGYYARNSMGGVHHGTMDEGWFGPVLGYGSIDEFEGSSGGGTGYAVVPGEVYKSKDIPRAQELASLVKDERMKEALRQLGIRQRKQSYETSMNSMLGESGDTREQQILEKYAEMEAEAQDKKKDIFKSVGADTKDPVEKARAEAEAEKAIRAEVAKDEMEKMQQLRELEDTKHEEAMSHIESMAYEEIMTADQSNMLKDQELSKFISMKKQELKTAKLTAQQRIALEKQITEAEKEQESIRSKSLQGGLDQLKRSITQYEADIGSTLNSGWQGVEEAWSSFGQNMITEHKSVTTRIKDLWKDMANSILNSLMRIAMQKTLENIITAVVGKRSTTSISTVASAADATSRAWDAVGYEYGLADGGMITGPGTSTSDSIPAMLSNGEYVVNAAAVKKVGVGFLEGINNGYVKHFASGGYVSGRGSSIGKGGPEVQVIVENNTGTQMQARTNTKNDGEKQITQIILSTVTEGIVSNRDHLRELIAGVR